MTTSVLVVGTGLIGSSIGLALRGQRQVYLTDTSPARLDEAVRRGAGEPWDGSTGVDLAVVCTPPSAVAPALSDLIRLDLARTFTHVSSVQAHVQADVEALGSSSTKVCGGHPLAGRERSGPAAAVGDLFLGRPWVLCPAPGTDPEALAAAAALAADCGATPLEMSASEHDAAVAASSHLVQVSASALAARLLDVPPEAVAVSGPGLADSTRVAGSDAQLWTDVLTANAAFVAPLVAALASDLGAAADALAALAAGHAASLAAGHDATVARAALRDLLERGNRGRARVPVKRGAGTHFVTVAVTLTDRPGELAHLFALAAAEGINVEDVRVEHLPGRPTGLVRLLVDQAVGDRLATALTAGGLPAALDPPS